jgi:NAD(P)H dehydrogenase (quinone)
MSKVLIVYFSRAGHVKKMAEWVAEGAKGVPDVEVVTKEVGQATVEDLLDADGIILGTPVYYGQMAAEMKAFIDSITFRGQHGKLQGKIGAAFISTGWADGGIATTILSIWTAMGIENMIIVPEGVGRLGTAGIQEVAALDPLKESKKVHQRCLNLGRRVAELAKILEKKIPIDPKYPLEVL